MSAAQPWSNVYSLMQGVSTEEEEEDIHDWPLRLLLLNRVDCAVSATADAATAESNATAAATATETAAATATATTTATAASFWFSSLRTLHQYEKE